jgi:hypothetical protein
MKLLSIVNGKMIPSLRLCCSRTLKPVERAAPLEDEITSRYPLRMSMESKGVPYMIGPTNPSYL